MQGYVQSTSDGRFAAVLEPREENGEALFEARGMGLSEYTHDFRVGEPFGDLFAGSQSRAEFGTADVEGAGARGDFVIGFVFIGVGEVDHLLERDDFDAEFFSVFLDGELCVVRAVEVFA